MIILFHFIFLITKYLVNTLSKSFSGGKNGVSEAVKSSGSSQDESLPIVHSDGFVSESIYLDGSLKFFPPVYVQRYEAVNLVLQEPQWKDTIRKVVDFGCAELSFFLYLKKIPEIEEILEVDIDEDVLLRSASKAAPLQFDYVSCTRTKPLDVYLFAGSASDFDDHLIGTDAVIAIELIEHLESEVLEKLPHNIFHEIQPRLAIFTTPNADFNVLLPNFVGFRHYDHKFEWSRREFYNWTREILKKYPNYSVKFYGIGMGPEGTENLGCCTQMAVFEKHENSEEESINLQPRGINNYKLIRRYDYPFNENKLSDEQKIINEVSYRLHFFRNNKKYYNYDEYLIEIPLNEIMVYVTEWCQSEDRLKEILLNCGFYMKEKDGVHFLVESGYQSDDSEFDDGSFDMDRMETESQQDCWDWDCGDFSRDVPPVTPEDDLPNFQSARSLQDVTENVSNLTNPHGFEHPDIIGDGMQERNDFRDGSSNKMKLNELPLLSSPPGLVDECQVSDGKSRSVTLSRIPRKREMGLNTSKSAKALKSWIHSQIGF